MLLNHYYNKKNRDKEDLLNLIEYLAMLTSFNPKAVSKIISARKKQVEMVKNSQENPDKYLKVNSEGQNEYGQHINTTFFEDLKKYGGEEALSGFEDTKDYKIDQSKNASEESEDEDDKFVKEAKRMFAERERELIEEEKFKKENPHLFEADSIIF